MDAKMDMRSNAPDEINLIDLLLVLLRRKNLFLTVLALCVVVAAAVILNRDNMYLYSTSLEIGSFYQDREQVFIDTPNTVVSKLQEGYIPAVLGEYYSANLESPQIQITARVPKNSEVIVIETKGKKEMGEPLKQLEAKIIERIKQDHARTIDVRKKTLLVHKENLGRQQEALKDKAVLLQSEKKRLQLLSELVTQQLASVKAQVEDVDITRRKARNGVGDESRAMTLLMIDNEINRNRNRLASLEERLYVTIPNKGNALDKALADNQRAQAANQSEIARLDVELKNFRETRAIIEPTVSSGPVGSGKTALALIGIVLGVVLATFSVFLAEFLATARQKLLTEYPRAKAMGDVLHVTPIGPIENENRSGTLG